MQHNRKYLDDLIIWPCGEWCFRSELHQFNHKSDDYEVISYTNSDYNKCLINLENM